MRVDELRRLVLEDTGLGDLFLRAYLQRRSILIEVGVGLRLFGSCYSPDTRRLREFAARNRLPHRFIDLDEDTAAESLLRHLGIAPDETPVVIWRGDGVLRNPTNAELARLNRLLPAPAPSTNASTTYSSLGRGRAGWPPRCTARRRGSTPSCWTLSPPEGRRRRRRASRTISAFLRGCREPSWPSGRCCRPEKFGAELAIPTDAVALEQTDGYRSVRLRAAPA